MSEISVSSEEEVWLKSYPDLTLKRDANGVSIVGTLTFDMVFYSEDHSWLINPDEKHLTHGERIQDSYDVIITFSSKENSSIPRVIETGGRIATVAKRKGVRIIDLHVSSQGECCLCLDIEEERFFPNGFNLKDFFHKLLIPFFYNQSYFEVHNRWKWGERAHGILAYFQWYAELPNPSRSNIEALLVGMRQEWPRAREIILSNADEIASTPCICGNKNGKWLKNCHPDILQGIVRLQADMAAEKFKL